MQITREFKIGITFIIALALLIWGFNFLKGRDVFNKENRYFVVYKSVNGLAKSSPVFLHGVRIGSVKKVAFMPNSATYPILVEFVVSSKLAIPANSIVNIYSADLMGSKAVDIRVGNSTVMAADGDTLKGFIQTTLQEEITQQIEPLKSKATSLMESIDSAMMVIRYVFNDKTRQNLETSFASIKNTLLNLEHISLSTDELLSSQKNRLSNILGNVESISLNLKNNNKKITNIVENFSNLSDTIAKANVMQTFQNLNSSLNKTSEILTKVSNGQGSLGKLLTNDSLYNALNQSSAQLDLLLEDVRLNPKRYVHFSVFGKKNAAPVEKAATVK